MKTQSTMELFSSFERLHNCVVEYYRGENKKLSEENNKLKEENKKLKEEIKSLDEKNLILSEELGGI